MARLTLEETMNNLKAENKRITKRMEELEVRNGMFYDALDFYSNVDRGSLSIDGGKRAREALNGDVFDEIL